MDMRETPLLVFGTGKIVRPAAFDVIGLQLSFEVLLQE
jgi:hypothetical protein